MSRNKGTIPICLGLALILGALSLAVYNIWTDRRAQASSEAAVNQLRAFQTEQSPAAGTDTTLPGAEPEDFELFPEMEMPVRRVEGRDYIGTLDIPSLELTLPIISWWSGEGFQIAPCRYTGSAYTADLVLAAHNYPSHFGRIGELSQGDGVSFTDMEGNVFSYEVIQQEILQGTDVEEMEEGDWDLTLFTCTIGGKYRVTVRCRQVGIKP